MSKKNLAVLFLLFSGVIAVLAYAGGKQSNRLSDSQINFTDKVSTKHGNKLTATIRDAVINGLTTRAQNHEKRLQAFAQNTGYPNLTPEQTSFTDLLSTNPKNNNQLTAEMRNDLSYEANLRGDKPRDETQKTWTTRSFSGHLLL